MKTLRNVRRWCEWFCIWMFAMSAVLSAYEGDWRAALAWTCASIWTVCAKIASADSDFWRRRYCHAAGIDEAEGEA